MAILAGLSPRCFSIFQRSMIQSDDLPLSEILDSTLIADAFQEDNVDFGIADEDVFTPATTLWAMVSQFLFKGPGRSCKAAAGRVVSLLAKTANRVVAQNAGRTKSTAKPSNVATSTPSISAVNRSTRATR
jgi:hypothetical protein